MNTAVRQTRNAQPEGFEVSAPIDPLLAARWSPRNLDPVAEVSAQDLRSMLEAARWAASWGGTAPARFVAGLRGSETFATISGLLAGFNTAWASHAGALVVGFCATGNEKGPFPYAVFDLGAATAQLCLQATSLGYVAHPMAGFDRDGAQAAFGAPEGTQGWVAIAIARHAQGAVADDPRDAEVIATLVGRDATPRRRPPLEEIAFGGPWGTPLGE